ncbi:MAG: DapH/DapD/GlmU-related protein [Planctomycetota bacterium]
MADDGTPIIHASAIVDAGAHVGPGTRIWHFTHVCAGARIGAGCSLGQNVYVAPSVVIGDGCKVQNNVSLYDGVVLEDEVFCGPSMVFTNVINPRSAVPRRDEFKSTLVRRGATIGANATILCGIELGHHCFIGAGAVVAKAVPAYALMVGVPARQIGWISRAGERLGLPVRADAGPLAATCPSTGERYRLDDDGLVPVA